MTVHEHTVVLCTASESEVRVKLKQYRPQLTWAVDALIPADADLKMPCASEAGVVDEYLATALSLRDDAAKSFLSYVAKLPITEPDQPLEFLKEVDARAFEGFCRIVAGAFFLDPQVNTSLGYTAQAEIRENPDYDDLIERIQNVIDRGEIYINA